MLSVINRTTITSEEMAVELVETLGFEPESTLMMLEEMHSCAIISTISLWRLVRTCIYFQKPWEAFTVFHEKLTVGSYITIPGAVTDIVRAIRKLSKARRNAKLFTADIDRLPWRVPIVIKGGRDRILPIVSRVNMALLTDAVYHGYILPDASRAS